jgi:gliding motility-associated-like protein
MKSIAIKIISLYIGIILLGTTQVFSQITAPNASASFSTNYSANYLNSGESNDQVFVFCGNQDENAIGELQVDATGCTVTWFEFSGTSYQPLGLIGSTATGLESGGYMAQVDCGGGNVTCYRAWVWVNQTLVDIDPIAPGCEAFTLQGDAGVLDNQFQIQDPPGTNFEVDENTEITVCFWADHTYVSDLGFYLKAPGHAMDEPAYPIVTDGNHDVVELLPSAADWGPMADQGSWTGIPWSALGCTYPEDENTNCQSGSDVQNFCFTSSLDAGSPAHTPCVCDLPTPLTGTFASVGPWDAIYGSLAGDEGWNVQIYDCQAIDVGSLTRATITFIGETECGTTTFSYDSGIISSSIDDNSCSAATASSYIVPPMDPPGEYTVSSEITSTVWSCTGSSFTSTELNPTLTPGTSDFPEETSDFILTVTETIDVPSAPSCEHTATETFVTTPSDATITPIAPKCYTSAPVAIEVADGGGEFSISASAGPDALVDGVFYPENAGSGIHTITYEITGACPDIDQIDVEVYEHIVVENFDDQTCVGTDYYVSFDVLNENGVGTTFQVDDGSGFTTNNNSYNAAFSSPSNYNITVTDMNGCDSYVFEGYRDCGCPNTAGTMSSLEVVNLCQGQSTGGSVSHTGNHIQDAGDLFEFILHDGTAYPADASSILAYGNNTNFSFISNDMNFDQMYYISAICGPANGEGHVDNTENCYSQSSGTPVVWRANPIVHINTNNHSVCGLTTELEGSEVPTGMVGSWSASGGNFVTSSGTNLNDSLITVNVSSYGDYTFTWSISNGNCVGTDVVNVSFFDTPDAYAGNDTIVCGSQVELNAILSTPGATGTWTGNGINFNPPSSENAIASLNSGQYGTYALTWTESLGSCSDQDYMTVTFVETPQPDISSSPDTICGIAGTISVNNVNFDGFWQAYDQFGDPVSVDFAPSSSSPTATVTINNYSGIYRNLEFVWTETNEYQGVQCENTASRNIVFAKVPNAFVGNDNNDEVCGNTYTFDADTTGTGWATMYWMGKENISYTFDDNTIPNANVTINPLTSFGDSAHVTVPFQWVVSSGGGCADIDTMWVTFYQEPIANAGLDNSVCGLQYELEAFYSLPNTDSYDPNGAWSNPSGNPSSVNFINSQTNQTLVNVGAPGVYDFVWTERNDNNTSCTSKDTVTITFKEQPVIDAGDDFDVCGNTATLSATTSGFDLTWQSTTGGVNFDDYTSAETGVQYGGYGPVTFTVGEANDECTSIDQVTVHFWREPSAEHSVPIDDTTQCGRVFTRLRAENPGAGVVGNWISDPSNGVNFYQNNYIDTMEVLNYGHYTVWWTESTGPDNEDPGFCSDTSEPFTIHFIEQPQANAGPDVIFCGYDGTMNAELSINNGVSFGSWFNVSANITFDDNLNPNTDVTSNVLTADNPSYDNFEFVWTENNYGCTSSDTIVVGFARIPLANLTIIPPRCEGEPASIKAQEDSLQNYDWSFPNSPGYQIDSVWVNDLGGEYRRLVSWESDDTAHVVSLSVENHWGCSSLTVQDTIYEPYRPEFEIVTYPDTCALGLGAFEFIPDSTTEFPSFSWFNAEGIEQPVTIGDTIYNIYAGTYDGTHQYRTFNSAWITQYIELFGSEQCIDEFEFIIDTAGVVVANFAISAATDMNALVAPNAEVIFDNLSDGDDVRTSCTWYFGDGESTNSCDDQVIHVYTDPNECYEPYLVIRVRDLPECRDTAFHECIIIDDMSQIEIPNIFTPNGDGMNDFFQVKAQTLQSFQGVIVNRWGRTVYEWTNYETMEAGWDGKMSGGGKAAAGVYYYIINAVGMDGVEYEEYGPFHLVREK